jgi:hypothetical protein
MLRWGKILVIFWMLEFGAMGLAKARPRDYAQLRVFVIEYAGVSGRTLVEAEGVAGRVFRMAGVDVSWVHCQRRLPASKTNCYENIQNGDLILRIVPNARRYTPEVFGVSFLDEAGHGTYADVFFAPIEQMTALDRELPLDAILGDVIAHELGHLLLGNHAHSGQGIMRARWQADQLHGLSAGRLFFTTDQAAQLRNNIRSLRERSSPLVVAEAGSINHAQ